jgi:cobalt/nickel transport protein
MSKLIAYNSWFVAKTVKILLALTAFLFFTTSYELPATGAGKWTGVDESVVEKYAKEHGREAWTPFINTDQGDLLLFVFLLAGTVGGFAAGYSWRMLVSEKSAESSRSNKT